MSDKHSPGPWRFINDGYTIVDANIDEVAQTVGGHDRWEADGLLIAAAPDLLVALADARAEVERLRASSDAAHLAASTECARAATAEGERDRLRAVLAETLNHLEAASEIIARECDIDEEDARDEAEFIARARAGMEPTK